MYLKSLKAVGFKSFAEKTVLNFEPGITAIVGPNGCGKSNISDAIRWVLGEQSAKALRGGEMADVIFSGTEGTAGRRPLSMAEVSLTLGDVDQEHLKAAGVGLEYNEITVTRRVFRDGESEYFLNDTHCRLRDIQQLFLGTGIGRASYSIMAQGQITKIIQSRPNDRRAIFEEAAGITRFKQQKTEALRKLEHTDQNLLRLDDIIREIKRQIGSLQRQAGKAKRHQKLSEELRHLETQLARHEWDLAESDLRRMRDQAERVRTDIESNSGVLLVEENTLKQIRNRLADLDRQVSLVQQRAVELRATVDRHESRLQFNQERRSETAGQRASAQRDIEEVRERHVAIEAELTSIAQQLADFSTTLKAAQNFAGERQVAVEQVTAAARQCQTDLDRAQATSHAMADRATHLRANLGALELQKQNQAQRLERLSAEKIQLEEERKQLEIRLHDFDQSSQSEQLGVVTQRGTVEQRQARLAEIDTQLDATNTALDELMRRQASLRTRRDVLQQLVDSREGFAASALAVLLEHPEARGSLADNLRVPPPFVAAIEAALGANLQAIFAERPQAAHSILASLSKTAAGRVHIIPLDLVGENLQGTPVAELPAGAKRATEVVEVGEAFAPAVAALLRDTLVVEDLAAAAEIWSATGGQFTLVTRTGEVLSRQGVYSGGNAGAGGPQSMLGRKNDIATLNEQLAVLVPQIEAASKGKGALLAEQTELRASLQAARTELSTREVAVAGRQGEHKALRHALQVLQQKIETVIYEIQSLADQDPAGKAKAAELQANLAGLEHERTEAQLRLMELQTSLDQLRQSRDEAMEKLTEARIQLAAAQQRESALIERRQPLQERLAEQLRTEQRAKATLVDCGRRELQLEQEDVESQAEVARLQVERDQISGQTAALVEQRNGAASEAESKDLSLSNRRNTLNDLQAEKNTLDVELAQKEMGQRHLVERVLQKHQVDLATIRSECITITITDNGQATVETLSPDEMAAGGAATNWQAVRERVVDLQEKIDAMGPVNLVAIQEYEEVEQRHNFLTAQHLDLVSAKSELMEVINRINKQSREMFTETFAKIRENFRHNFPDLFGGGKADLVLTEESDALDSGVEIMAQPPGKHLRSISLLSGGEQTMTAVALLFSIYQVRPSPFCVLDELDAPLDDSNIERFLNKLKSFLAHSQFLVITHNKRTIAASDVLYGVTMQERGVSRIVSVKFSADGTPSRNAPPPDVMSDTQNGNGSAARESEEVFLAK